MPAAYGGANQPSTWVVFESEQNPGYPADYIEYPNLPWFQPTFPRAGERYTLHRNTPLTLRYRFWIIPGNAPAEDVLRCEWAKFNSTPLTRKNQSVLAAPARSSLSLSPSEVPP